ncbi:ROK family protein [Herbiconiux sp. YIM B11900]|uniref:ROK family protein n=1 Tax=Herbiconiux sp. YIM B11900 TaxID=3404131 RepID=UPI003F8646B4
MAVQGAGGAGHGDHLEFIRRAGQTTRRAIAEHTGLSRSVVAHSVAELIEQGLVVERRLGSAASRDDALRARRGRPTSVLELAEQPGVVVACDIGHRHITVAVVDLQSRVLLENRIGFAVDDSAAETFRVLHRLISDALRRTGATMLDVKAFGVSLPFPVVRDGTVMAPSGVTGWRGVTAAAVRPAGISGPLLIDNDANFGAWGERLNAGSRQFDNLLYVKISHGVGSGVIVDGRLLSGAHGTGGEMGHIQVEQDGPLCRCGRRGCLETVIAMSLPDHHLAGLRVGRAIAQLCSFIDAEVVVLGGRLGASGGPLVDGVREAFDRLLPEPRVAVRCAALGERSELVGVIDRTLTAAWSEETVARHADPHSSWGRTNSRVVLDVPFDAERLALKE